MKKTKTIDFRHFKAFIGITQEKTETIDISLKFADMLYTRVNGIVAHDLALRIYKAQDPVEFTEEELAAIMPFVEEHFTPAFIDSFNANVV